MSLGRAMYSACGRSLAALCLLAALFATGFCLGWAVAAQRWQDSEHRSRNCPCETCACHTASENAGRCRCSERGGQP